MSEELGRIQRPTASQYDGRRKLMLVPLIYGPQADDLTGAEVLKNYWDQMQTQVNALEGALGGLQHIYHESLTVGGPEHNYFAEGILVHNKSPAQPHDFVFDGDSSDCDDWTSDGWLYSPDGEAEDLDSIGPEEDVQGDS